MSRERSRSSVLRAKPSVHGNGRAQQHIDSDRLAVSGMRCDEVIDRRAGCRLTTFVEPEAWNHPRIIGSPDARDEARR